MIHTQRQVGGEGLAHGLAVVPGLSNREHLKVGFNTISYFQQYVGALGRRCGAPGIFGSVCGIQSQLDISR